MNRAESRSRNRVNMKQEC